MPVQIREYTQQTSPQNVGGVGAVNPTQVDAVDLRPLEAGLAHAGEIIQRQQRADRIRKVRSAVGDATLELKQLGFDLSQDGDPLTRGDRFKEQSAKIREKFSADLIGGEDTEVFNQEFRANSMSEHFDIQRGAVKEQQERAVAGLEQDLAKFQQVGSIGTSEQSVFAKKSGLAAIDEQVAAGTINDVMGGRQKRAFTSEIDIARFQTDVLANPRQAEAALAGGGYEDIDPSRRAPLAAYARNQVQELERIAKAEARERLADQREAQRELQFGARMAFEDEAKAATRGETVNPEINRQLIAAWGPEKAQPMIDQISKTREAASVAKSMNMLPAAEIGAIIDGHAPEGTGFAVEADNQEMLVRVARDTLNRREQDPAGEALRSFPSLNTLLSSDNPDDVARGMRQNAQIQTDIFGMSPDLVKPLPKATAETLVERFKAASDPSARLALLAPLTTGLDDPKMAGQTLAQLRKAGLPPEAEAAMARWRDGDETSAKAVMGLIGSTATLPVDKRGEFRTAMEKDRISGPAAATSLLGQWTGGEGRIAQQIQEEEGLIERRVSQLMDLGTPAKTATAQARAEVRGSGKVIADPQLGAVRLGEGEDVPAITTGLTRLRQRLPEFVKQDDVTKILRDVTGRNAKPGAIPDGVTEQGARDLIDDWSEQGRWVNDGDGFALLVPGMGKVPGLRWSKSDVLDAAK